MSRTNILIAGRIIPEYLRTQWFKNTDKPKRKGWYEVRNRPGLLVSPYYRLQGKSMRWWDGKHWKQGPPGSIFEDFSAMGSHESHEWRGLLERMA